MATPSTKWNPRDYQQETKRLRATAERYKKEAEAAKNQVRQTYIWYMYLQISTPPFCLHLINTTCNYDEYNFENALSVNRAYDSKLNGYTSSESYWMTVYYQV